MTLPWKIAIAAILLTAFAGSYGLTYWKGYEAGKSACEAKSLHAAIKHKTEAAKDREKIEDETRRLSDTDVDRQLINNGWMRNATDR